LAQPTATTIITPTTAITTPKSLPQALSSLVDSIVAPQQLFSQLQIPQIDLSSLLPQGSPYLSFDPLLQLTQINPAILAQQIFQQQQQLQQLTQQIQTQLPSLLQPQPQHIQNTQQFGQLSDQEKANFLSFFTQNPPR